MFETSRRDSITVFRVYDREGRAIGQVVQPTSPPVMGIGAKTVLLLRSGKVVGQTVIRG